MRPQGFSRGRKHNVRFGPHEEFGAERFLKEVNPRAHRRLADVQSLGRAMEAAIGSHRQKRLDLIQFHNSLAFNNLRRVLVFRSWR